PPLLPIRPASSQIPNNMNATVFAAIVGCLSAVLTSVLAGFLSHRKLRAELTAGHRRELISRQILACERLWSALRPISIHAGMSSVITQQDGSSEAHPKAIEEFCENVTSLFFSPTGLYLSREVRTALFEMRDFLTGCVDAISETLPIRLEKSR